VIQRTPVRALGTGNLLAMSAGAGTFFVIILAVTIVGPQFCLAPICTGLMYAHGWTCLTIWLVAAVASTPLRASGSEATRAVLHGVGWTLTWLWWFVAIALADLHSRADLLFLSYVVTAVAIAIWRLILHHRLLRFTVRHALHACDYAPGVIRFAGGEPPFLAGFCPRTWSNRLLEIGARARRHRGFARFHAALYGPSGQSYIVLDEVMRKTDALALALRATLASDNETSAESIARVAERLMLGARCEIEVWIASRANCDEVPAGGAIQLRAAAIYSTLSLCIARGCIQSCPVFTEALAILVKHESLSPQTLNGLISAEKLTIAGVEKLLQKVSTTTSLNVAQQSILRLSMSAALARLRLYRPAQGLLGDGKKILETMLLETGTPHDSLARNPLVRGFNALTSEVIQRSIADATHGRSGIVQSESDKRVLRHRCGLEVNLRNAGDHPLTGIPITPSEFRRLPFPRRPRETGTGALTMTVACLVLATSLCIMMLPGVAPLSDRMQVAYDIPFGGQMTSPGIQSATVVNGNGSPTALLADQSTGVRTFNFKTLSMDHEGGPGTALSGQVQGLASNSDGTAFAIFNASSSGNLCLSVRDRNGRWDEVIGSPLLQTNGNEIEALLFGLSEPLLLRREGEKRLLRYDESVRTLREAGTEDAVPIVGRFVDFAERSAKSEMRGTVLLTKVGAEERPQIYSIEEQTAGGNLTVRTIGIPPIEQRTVVAVSVDQSDRLLALDSSGGVWRTDMSPETMKWQRIRPGDQGLRLDSVDLAAVTDSGTRLWFIRKGEIWTRALPENGDEPSNGDGWSHEALPKSTVAALGMRPLLFLSPKIEEDVYLLAPTPKNDIERGSILRIRVSGVDAAAGGHGVNKLEMTELLEPNERLLDADSYQGIGLLTILREPSPPSNAASLALDILDGGRRTIRTTPNLAEISTLNGVLAAERIGDDALLVFRNGSVVRIDPARDGLLPVDPGQPSLIEQVTLPANIRDAAIDPSPSIPMMRILDATGLVTEQPSYGDPKRKIVVNGSDGPPGSLLANMRFVVTDSSGAMMLSPSSAWRFSVERASDHFEDDTAMLGKVSGQLIATTTSDGTPAVAWLASDGAELRYFLNGKFFTSKKFVEPLNGLLPGCGNSGFARSSNDALWTVPVGEDASITLTTQSGGPATISETSIRKGYIDYLTPEYLHSIDRASGGWSTSPRLKSPHSLHAIQAMPATSTLLIPSGTDTPKIVDAGQPASAMRELKQLGSLSNSLVLGDGAIGLVNANESIGWVSMDGKGSDTLQNYAIPGVNLTRVNEAIGREQERVVFLRGSGSDPATGAVVRCSMDHMDMTKASMFRSATIRAMEFHDQTLFVLDAHGVWALESTTLLPLQQEAWPVPESAVLGSSDDGPVAIASKDGISMLSKSNPPRMVLMSPASAGAFEPIRLAALWADRVILFTDRGAWERGAQANQSFKRVATIDGRADTVLFDPRATAPWVRVGGEWISAFGNARKVGKSIGWTADGSLVRVDSGDSLIIGDNPVDGFGRAGSPIGEISGVEKIDSTTVLLIGSTGSVIFDTKDRSFRNTPLPLARQKDGATIIERANLPTLLLSRNGEVTTLDALNPQTLFGGERVEEDKLFAGTTLCAISRKGIMIDDAGNPIRNVPKSFKSKPIDIISAVAIGNEIIRIREDRRIDRFNTVTLDLKADELRRADELAISGSELLALDRVDHRIFSLDRKQQWPATRWFVGSQSVAALGEDGRVYRLDLDSGAIPQPDLTPAALPGKIDGNLDKTTVVLTHNPDNSYSLFDVRDGRVVVSRITGSNPTIVKDKVFSVDDDKQTIRSTNASGVVSLLEKFDSPTLAQAEFKKLTEGQGAIPRGTLVEPLKWLDGKTIVLNEQLGAVRIGTARTGTVLGCHKVVAFAPLENSKGVAWIDKHGQLWTREAGVTRCAAIQLDLRDFCVDEERRLHARSQTSQYLIAKDANGVIQAKETATKVRLVKDCNELPSRAGPVTWTRTNSNSKSITWSMNVSKGAAIAMQATETGFDLFAEPQLVLQEDEPSIMVRSGTSLFTAPIRSGAVDWTVLAPRRATNPPAPRALKRSFTTPTGTMIRVESNGSRIEFGGMQFRFIASDARFECNRCLAASASADSVFTLLGNRKLVEWKQNAQGALVDPRPLPPPPNAQPTALWTDGKALVVDSIDATGEHILWRWDRTVWSPYVIPTIVRAPGARWDWHNNDQLVIDGESYSMAKHQWPLLDCEVIDLAGNPTSPCVRTDAGGVVKYRVKDGRWFQLRENRMPITCDEPSAPKANYRVGQLEFNRWPTAGNLVPSCKFAGINVSLVIEDGLIRDIDGWNAESQMTHITSDRVLLSMRAKNIYRPIELKGGKLTMLDPLVDNTPNAITVAPPIKQDAQLKLNGNNLVCGKVVMGQPSQDGFELLRPGRIIPLLNKDDALDFAQGDSVYRTRIGSILDSIERTRSNIKIASVNWESSDGVLRFVVTSVNGQRFQMDPRDRDLKPVSESRSGTLTSIATSDKKDCFVATKPNAKALTLQRSKPEPMEITLQLETDDKARLVHTEAKYIENSEGGFTTYSDDWVARYIATSDGYRLASVKRIESAAARTAIHALGSGLYAQRSADGGISIKTREKPDAALWPMSAFGPADRWYLTAENQILEASSAWTRISTLDGDVLKRWAGDHAKTIANDNAFREGKYIFDGANGFSVSTMDGVVPSDAKANNSERGRIKPDLARVWAISLRNRGADLQLTYLGVSIPPSDGALPMDFAVAMGSNEAGSWVIDRQGSACTTNRETRWSAHTTDVRASLAKSSGVRLSAIEADGKPQRFVASSRNGLPIKLALPSSPAGQLHPTSGTVINSWTIGEGLKVFLGEGDKVYFSRQLRDGAKWFSYPPIPRDQCCRFGRFAFDSPVRLILATRPGDSTPEPCLEMELGFEWPTKVDSTRGTVFQITRPTAIDPEFGPIPRSEWLTQSDLTLEALDHYGQSTGKPIIWFPRSDRIFLIGDSSVIWIELGRRWQNPSPN